MINTIVESTSNRISISDIVQDPVLTLLILSPFFDALTGWLILSGIMSEGFLGSPSQLFRGCVFLLVLSRIATSDTSAFLGLLTVTVSLLVLECISFIALHRSLIGYFIGLTNILRISFFYSLLIWSKYTVLKYRLSYAQLERAIVFSGLVYASVVLLSLVLDVGFRTYGPGTGGSKGFFASGNALSVTLGCVSLVALYSAKRRRQTKAWIEYAVILLALVAVGTKGSIGFFGANLVLIGKRYAWISFPAILVLVGYFLSNNLIGKLFDVILSRFENRESLLTFFVSGRDNYLKNALVIAELNDHPGAVLFGRGALMSFRPVYTNDLLFDTLESDPVDIFFMYGLAGLTVYLLFVLRTITKFHGRIELQTAIVLFLGYSMVAGHSLFNQMAAGVFACIHALGMVLNMENE